jgi:D-aminopeptidase
VGRELGRYANQDVLEAGPAEERGDGSDIVIIATDSPEGERKLGRIAARTMMGLGRTGSSASNGSGDYALAFSTSPQLRRSFAADRQPASELANDATTALFQATVEAVEEAVYNSLFMATTVTGNGQTVPAIPLDRVRDIHGRHGISAEK